MNRTVAATLALALATATAGAGYAVDAAANDHHALGPGTVTIDVGIHYSKFSTKDIDVRPGTLVRFVVHNDDPINHEFIVGDDAVHASHRNGTGLVHPPVPGEVSVPPGETGITFYRFTEPGTLLYACHLPAHFEYGMRGNVRVAD